MKKTYSKPSIDVTSLRSGSAIASTLTTSGDVQTNVKTLSYSTIQNY